VKLTDLIHQIGNVTREATNFVRYPVQMVSQRIRNTAQEQLERAEVPFLRQRESSEQAEVAQTPTSSRTVQSNSVSTLERTDVEVARDTVLVDQAIAMPRECTGRRGKYQIEELLNSGESFHLYRGVWARNQAPVLIQAYRLDKFNREELRHAKELLERLESVSLRNSTGQDFRIITPWDTAIATTEKRGYLITQSVPNRNRTLRDYLNQYLTMPPQQVRQVLLQVLQTLWFLHNHPIRFTDGVVQYGLLHGNLSLDSLVMMVDPQSLNGQDLKFFIYLKDLALWQVPFHASSKGTASKKTVSSFEALQPKFFQRDLTNLGAIGFCLLTGDRSDRAFQPNFDPDNEPPDSRWHRNPHDALKNYIRRLLGCDRNTFGSAEQALQSLPSSTQETVSQGLTPVTTEAREKIQMPGCLWLLPLGLLLASGGWWLVRSLTGQSPIALLRPKPPTAIQDVSALKTLPMTPTRFAASEAWKSVIGVRRSSFDSNLQDELNRRSGFRLRQLQLHPASDNPLTLQQQLQSGKLAFVLSDSTSDLSNLDLEKVTVAYDGVAVVTAFSDGYRATNIPKQLNGEISLQQLQKTYIEDKSNFRRLFPKDDIATTVFRNTLFPDAEQDPVSIQRFDRLRIDVGTQPVNAMFETILKNFEAGKQPPTIGFARISQVYGQCSVYPLAITTANGTIQPFVQDNGKPINPELDLCNTKGGYWLDPTVFTNKQYPFVYQLNVVYSKSNGRSKQIAEAFIATLKTDEGQCLLSEAGLVPLTPIQVKGVCRGTNPP